MTAVKEELGSLQINVAEFYDITNNILNNLVNNSTSPFKVVSEKFEDYLDGLQDGEMDNVQKASAYAEFLKQIYSQVNDKAIGAALELLKFNKQIVIETAKTESSIFASDVASDKTMAETLLTEANTRYRNKEIDLIAKSIEVAEVNVSKTKAELRKQWGVKSQTEFTLNGNKYGPITTANGTFYYRLNDNNQWLMNQHAVNTYNTANPTTAVTYGVAVTVTPLIDGEICATTTTFTIEDTISTDTPGIVDQQIKGYDLMNLKDVLKTGDEKAALLSNAKVFESSTELTFRRNLINSLVSASEKTLGVNIPELT